MIEKEKEKEENNEREYFDFGDSSLIITNDREGFLEKIISPKIVRYNYEKNLVNVGIDLYKRKLFSISFSDAQRILILGKTGSGKTLLMRGIFLDRCYRSEVLPIVLTDLKPEFFSSSKPAQEKFHKKYLQDEHPEGLPLIVYYPKCFEKFIPEYENYLNIIRGFDIEPIPISISFDKLTLPDFITLIGRDLSEAQKSAIEEVFKKKSMRLIKDIDELKKEINKLEVFDQKTKKILIMNIQNLIDYHILDEKYNFDIIKDINQNKICILSLGGYVSLGESRYFDYVSAIVAVFLREILAGKMMGKIHKTKKLVLLIDEASNFVPPEGDISSKREILKCLDLGRIYSISMVFSTQVLRRIHVSVFEQSNYIFLASNIDIDVATEVFKRTQLLPGVEVNQYKKNVLEIFSNLRRYQWLVIDREMKRYNFVKPLTPLSHHLEE